MNQILFSGLITFDAILFLSFPVQAQKHLRQGYFYAKPTTHTRTANAPIDTSHLSESIVIAQNTRGRNGVIQGSISYPSEGIPALTLCAQSTTNYREIQCIKTKIQQKKFKITVPPGEYYIFSYEKNGFLDSSTGKFSDIIMYHANWEDNSNPIPIRVSTGKTVSGILPQNYVICRDRNPTPAYCIKPKR